MALLREAEKEGLYSQDRDSVCGAPDVTLWRLHVHDRPLRGPTAVQGSGLRSYNPELGRWLRRDPLYDSGFLYSMHTGLDVAWQDSDREQLHQDLNHLAADFFGSGQQDQVAIKRQG